MIIIFLMNREDEKLLEAAKKLVQAEALFITAGAGMGVDSGLPDFRGDEGFWKAYPPMRKLGISFAEMANPHWFRADPELAWGFYGHRLNLYRETEPHEGFSRLLELGKRKRGGYFVFTSNVDGQFQKAGFDNKKIKECHGSIHHLQCTDGCGEAIWSTDQTYINVNSETFRARQPLPTCIYCGSLARPNILMFGDWDWLPHRTNEQSYRLSTWINNIRAEGMELAVVEIGAGHAVPTVRIQSEQVARNCNGTLIRINPRDDDVPPGHISIPLGGGEGIRAIFEKMETI